MRRSTSVFDKLLLCFLCRCCQNKLSKHLTGFFFIFNVRAESLETLSMCLLCLFSHKLAVAAEMFCLYCLFLVEANIHMLSVCYYEIEYLCHIGCSRLGMIFNVVLISQDCIYLTKNCEMLLIFKKQFSMCIYCEM